MMKKSLEPKIKEKDILSQYFNEVSSAKLLSTNEEVEAFRRVEAAEHYYISVLLRERGFWRNCLHFLEKMAIKSKEWTPEFQESTKSVESSSPSKKALYYFVRHVRFTDAGRTWIRMSYIRSQDEDRKAERQLWARQVVKAYEAIQEAKNKCVTSNLRLVVSIAKKHVKPGSSQHFTDLIQEGNIGLMKAVDRFDLERGYKFATYATWWVKHHIRRSVDEKESMVRIPVHVGEDAKRVNRVESQYLTQHGELPDDEELARISKISIKKVEVALMNRLKASLSLDTTVGDDDSTWVECIEDPNVQSPIDNLALAELRGNIEELFEHITPQERDILRWRFGFDGGEEVTLKQIGEHYNLSRERIRQLEVQAIRKMRVKAEKMRVKSEM